MSGTSIKQLENQKSTSSLNGKETDYSENADKSDKEDNTIDLLLKNRY